MFCTKRKVRESSEKAGREVQSVFSSSLPTANYFLAGPDFFFQQAKMFLVQNQTRFLLNDCITYKLTALGSIFN